MILRVLFEKHLKILIRHKVLLLPEKILNIIFYIRSVRRIT